MADVLCKLETEVNHYSIKYAMPDYRLEGGNEAIMMIPTCYILIYSVDIAESRENQL